MNMVESGANQTLTNGTTILDRFGSIQTKEYNNNDNPFNMLISPVESCTTLWKIRILQEGLLMGNQQTGQFAQLESQCSFGSDWVLKHIFLIWFLCRFSKKAKIDGK